MTFGRLTVIERASVVKNKMMWRCRCTCGKEIVVAESEISGHELKKYIKGFIMRNLFDFNSYMKFVNQDDAEILKALEILKNGGQSLE